MPGKGPGSKESGKLTQMLEALWRIMKTLSQKETTKSLEKTQTCISTSLAGETVLSNRQYDLLHKITKACGTEVLAINFDLIKQLAGNEAGAHEAGAHEAGADNAGAGSKRKADEKNEEDQADADFKRIGDAIATMFGPGLKQAMLNVHMYASRNKLSPEQREIVCKIQGTGSESIEILSLISKFMDGDLYKMEASAGEEASDPFGGPAALSIYVDGKDGAGPSTKRAKETPKKCPECGCPDCQNARGSLRCKGATCGDCGCCPESRKQPYARWKCMGNESGQACDDCMEDGCHLCLTCLGTHSDASSSNASSGSNSASDSS